LDAPRDEQAFGSRLSRVAHARVIGGCPANAGPTSGLVLRLGRAKPEPPAARYLPYGSSPILCAIIERRWQARTPAGDGAVFVFHRSGKRIRDFRGAWEGACDRAGVPDLLFHDLRRSAVNNLNAAKVPPKVAMRITGHKTMATYQRYHIVTDDDVQAALELTDAAISAAVAKEGGRT